MYGSEENMKRMGRPPKKPEDRSQFQRIAVKQETYLRIKYNAAKADRNMMDYIDEVIPVANEYEV